MRHVLNKARNASQRMKGKAKAAAGHATRRRRLVAKGKADQGKAAVRQTAERIRDRIL